MRMLTLKSKYKGWVVFLHTVLRKQDAKIVEGIAHRILEKYATGNEWFSVSREMAIEAVQMACLDADRSKEKNDAR